MKNILIPTTYEIDSTDALKVAADICQHLGCGEIILFSISEISDSITELLFLSSKDNIDLKKRDAVLQFWETYRSEHRMNTTIKFHHQYGLSRPVLEQIIDRFGADMVIVPQSFQLSKNYIHQFALKLFNQCNSPMMLLPGKNLSTKSIQRALYLDKADLNPAGVVQQYPFHVIHQSMIETDGQESIRTLVEKMQIDLIVKGKRKTNTSDYEIDSEELGLPILTI